MEPAALGVPIVTGPDVSKTREMSHRLVEAGASIRAADADELTRELSVLLSDPERRRAMSESGKRLVARSRGCVARVSGLLAGLLAEESPPTGASGEATRPAAEAQRPPEVVSTRAP
ncbi:glycosyltransferase [Alkalilimnicola ehrlichii]|uniref:glycosyltransferase family protein n=1 Tax=Alkalilimnicola ehrlichii TaxID=351052 RepID=UPI001C6E748B|nr:glycosyltransferase [Alkalilimnicola ehrlichii]